jgi:hypothetical protein
VRIRLPSDTLSPHRDRELLDLALGRRRDVHRRLVGLERDQRVLDRHLVARRHEDLDDRHVREVADVRHADLDRLVRARVRAVRRLVVGRRLRGLLDDALLRGRAARRRAAAVRGGALEEEDHRALGDRVADVDAQLLHRAGLRRGNVHRRLVRLQRDQRILGRHLVARRDVHLDDRHIGEVADVGDADLDRHYRSPLRMSDSTPARCVAKRAASAPSITRWS